MYSFSVGDTFHGRYRILAQLGKGGMGEVYRARQMDVEREVAIKILPFSNIMDQNDRERFLREFKILSRLAHPNIMSFYNLAVTDAGVPYAVCELLCGISLREEISKNNQLAWQRAIKIWMQICSAMQSAHEIGIIHRDLKPENVMLETSPEPDFVKLIDFGLARTVGEVCSQSQKLTFTGQLIGSVHYMSPEQGMGAEADARSDIYSIGCLMFEALSGEKLFETENPIGTLHEHKNRDPKERFGVLATRMPEGLASILLKCLQKSPSSRYSSASEMQKELESFLANESLHQISSARKPWLVASSSLSKIWIPAIILAPLIVAAAVKFKPGHSNIPDSQGKGQGRSVLLPRTGLAVHQRIEALITSNKDGEADALARAWLDKYEKRQDVELSILISMLHDLIRIRSKSEKTERFTDPEHLIARSEAVLTKLHPAPNDSEAILIKYRVTETIARWYSQGSSMRDQQAAAKYFQDCWTLLKSAKLIFDVWDNPLDLCDHLMDYGFYSDAKAFLERFREHLQVVDRSYELKHTIGIKYYMYAGEIAVVYDDNPAEALSSFNNAYKALADWFVSSGTLMDDTAAVGVRDTTFTLRQRRVEELTEESYVAKLSALASDVSFISPPLCRKWLNEIISRYNANRTWSHDWARWSQLTEIAMQAGLFDLGALCADKACQSYLHNSPPASAQGSDVFHFRCIKSRALMLDRKVKESILEFQKACKEFAPGGLWIETVKATYEMALSIICSDKAVSEQMRSDAIKVSDQVIDSTKDLGSLKQDDYLVEKLGIWGRLLWLCDRKEEAQRYIDQLSKVKASKETEQQVRKGMFYLTLSKLYSSMQRSAAAKEVALLAVDTKTLKKVPMLECKLLLMKSNLALKKK